MTGWPPCRPTSHDQCAGHAPDGGIARLRTRDLLSAAELARDTIEDQDARIPASAALMLWNALRERSGDPALQFVAPITLPFGAYRVIDYLVDASATVGEGIGRSARFFGLIADAMALTIEAAAPRSFRDRRSVS
jgi:hypothetical protein